MATLFVFCSDPVNRGSLKTIEESTFILCLDKSLRVLRRSSNAEYLCHDDVVDDVRDDANMALQMMHGGRLNGANRWFDKTMQVTTSRIYYLVISCSIINTSTRTHRVEVNMPTI